MTFKLNEEILRKALLLELEEYVDNILPEYNLPHTFSKKFERKIEILQRRAARPHQLDILVQVAKKVAMILLAVSVVSFTTIISVEALRVKFFKFVEQKFKAYSIVFYEATQTNLSSNSSSKEFADYVPKNIPTGFHLVDDYREGKVRLRFINSGGKYIQYQQTWINDAEMRVNTEGTELEACNFGGYEANYYMNIDSHTLMWNDGEYAYFVASNADKETVFSVAKSVKSEK